MFDLIIIGALFVYLCSLVGYHIDSNQISAACVTGTFSIITLIVFIENLINFRKRLKEKMKNTDEKIKEIFDNDKK